MTQSAANNKHYVSDTSYYEWVADGQILVICVGDHEPSTIEALTEYNMRVKTEWDANRPYHVIYESSRPRVLLTPYMRKQLAQINQTRRDLPGRTAIVTTNLAVNHAAKLFVATRNHPARQYNFFDNRADAIEWILSQ